MIVSQTLHAEEEREFGLLASACYCGALNHIKKLEVSVAEPQ